MDTKQFAEKISFLEKRIEALEGQVQALRDKLRDTSKPLPDQLFETDPLFEEAVAIISGFDKASASLIQRRLKIGYARAARLLDALEQKGYVEDAEGSRPRTVIKKTRETSVS